MLTARSDGVKNKPFVLLMRKRPDPRIVEKFKNKLQLSWAGKIWMDDSLTKEYLEKIFGHSLFGKRLLVWDAFRCHLSDSTKGVLRELKLHTAVVPGGCTKFIQVFCSFMHHFLLSFSRHPTLPGTSPSNQNCRSCTTIGCSNRREWNGQFTEIPGLHLWTYTWNGFP